MSDFVKGDRVQLRMTVGDRRPDGNLDVTIEVFADLPLDGQPRMRPVLQLGPFETPIDRLAPMVGELLSRIAPVVESITHLLR